VGISKEESNRRHRAGEGRTGAREYVAISHTDSPVLTCTLAVHLQKLRAEEHEVAKIVKEQNLTPEEVNHMNTKHEHLERSLEDLKFKLSESHKAISALEVTLANRAASTEEAIDVYNKHLAQLGFFPSLPEPFEGMDLGLSLNPAAPNPQGLLRGLNVRDEIRPTLVAIAKAKRAERASVESERVKLDHDLDQLAVECENLEVEVANMEKNVLAKEDEANDLRDVRCASICRK
jgi:kinetochore protein NDC80